MTAAVHRMGTPSLSVPPSQNTAPVLEFNCLYTHDIRRKQKRWQDGFLRFHTFNKRVMIYDVPRNFIGDMHWKEEHELREGDEMTLEKDAVLVQVAESVGRTETDLTELKQSAKKSKRAEGGQRSSSPARNVATPSRAMGPPLARPSAANTAGGNTQLKHRSLNALLGTPKGPIGKAAVPTKSPFEARQAEENEEWESGRPPKRARAEPWNVTRTTTTPKPKEIPLWKRTSEARAKAVKRVPLPPGQQKLGTKEVIDLSDEGDDSPSKFLPGFSSGAVGPASSPVREIPRPDPPAPKQLVRSSSPAFQTQNVAKAKQKEMSKIQQETPSKQGSNQRAEIPAPAKETPQRLPSPASIAPPFLPPPSPINKPSQTLRMASSAPKRKTLACLDQMAPPSEGPSKRPTTTESGKASSSKRKTQKELLEERLARMKKIAQQKADDLNAIIDDADATALEIDQMEEAPLPSRQPEASAPSRHAEPPPDEPVPAKPDRSFRRVVSERGTAASASTSVKRLPGAPVRFKPSPTMRAAQLVTEQPKSRPKGTVSTSKSTESEQKVPEGDQLDPTVPVRQQNPVRTESPARAPSPRPQEQAQTARRRPGIGRKEVRKSAQACFPTALNVAADGTSTVMLAKPFQAPRPPAQPKPPPPANEAGPWTREAFDLFEWRPPGWDEEKWCVSNKDDDLAS